MHERRSDLESKIQSLEAQVAAQTGELIMAKRALEAETRRREAAQSALLQSQKLEVLGQLTSGIAHDFNNILTAITGGMDLIQKRIEDKQIREIAGHCKEAAFRGAGLIERMLAFARQETLAPVSVDLAALADEIAPLLIQAIPGNQVTLDFPDHLPHVRTDPVLLETALLNLAVNARDAMPEGGTLAVTARAIDPRARGHPHELAGHEGVAITVRDSGKGMSPEVLQHAQEPFYTTKPAGRGTGLGLAMVHGFVTESGGVMRIESGPGGGTAVTLYLPAEHESAEPPAACKRI